MENAIAALIIKTIDGKNKRAKVSYFSFPTLATKGLVRLNACGTFDIYINNVLPDDEQGRTLLHEVLHIKLNHFFREITVKEAEQEVYEALLHMMEV